ncbi:hypothetical protein AVEN_157973-1 [Araneus ventricosus]|uniref:Uncharacterized protein n=1 Tax=Araneus ventricosus TaxID=182803 RepID=A0A4Y2JYG9_ARAVE|nr:hypothetical protein AVEN_157973-1 [Araneus ventricosus]
MPNFKTTPFFHFSFVDWTNGKQRETRRSPKRKPVSVSKRSTSVGGRNAKLAVQGFINRWQHMVINQRESKKYDIRSEEPLVQSTKEKLEKMV